MKKVKRAQNKRIKNLKYVENIFFRCILSHRHYVCERERESIALYTIMHPAVFTP